MNKTQSKAKSASASTHRGVQHSSTLNRKYVKRPESQKDKNAKSIIASAAEAEAKAQAAIDQYQDQQPEQIHETKTKKSTPTKIAIEITEPIPDEPETSEPTIDGPATDSVENEPEPAPTEAPADTPKLVETIKREEKPAESEAQDIEPAKAEITDAPAEEPAEIPAEEPIATEIPDLPATEHPYQKLAKERKAREIAQGAVEPQISAKERKDQAIQQALRSVATMEQDSAVIATDTTAKAAKSSQPAKRARRTRSKHTHVESNSGAGKRFLIAFTCAAACVATLAFFVNTNMPDISVRVAAMQTGIEATYPTYIPRDYSLANIDSGEGQITMEFTNTSGDSFSLTESKSSWDSNALLNNYVKTTWGEAYTSTHEQGITIYISGSDAVWVNGGILYTLDASSNNLTKKQIRNIVTSL